MTAREAIDYLGPRLQMIYDRLGGSGRGAPWTGRDAEAVRTLIRTLELRPHYANETTARTLRDR
jgi:hypothetical protein